MPTTLLDALDSPALFAPFFPSSTWGPWKAFCRAVTRRCTEVFLATARVVPIYSRR